MTSFSGAESAFYAMRIVERWEKTPDHPLWLRRESPLEEERREVLESVLQAMATAEPDPDRTAACCYLLRHLALGHPRGGGTGRG
jgi:hypothetical protein